MTTTHLDLSDDGTLMIAGGQNGLSAYITEPSLHITWSRSVMSVKYVDISANKQRVAAVEDDGLILILDANTGDVEQALRADSRSLPTSALFSPDGNLLGVGMWGGDIAVWDLVMQEQIYAWKDQTEPIPSGGLETMVVWSSDGDYVLAGGWWNEVLIWDVTTGELHRSITVDSDFSVSMIAISPDDKYVAVNSDNNQVSIYELEGGTLLENKQVGPVHSGTPGGRVFGLAWSPDSTLLASSDDGGTINIWETENYSLLKHIDLLQGQAANSIQWSPDGKLSESRNRLD